MTNLSNTIRNMTVPNGLVELRENKSAPYAAYDVLVKRAGDVKGRHVFTLVYSLCGLEPMQSLLSAIREG